MGSIHEKIGQVFGPLSSIWEFVESERNTLKSTSSEISEGVDENASMNAANTFCTLMEMAVTLLGQAFNSVSYYRRRNVLMTLMKEKKKVKETLIENGQAFKNNHSNKLFGPDFDERVGQHLKLIKKSKEFLNVVENREQSSSASTSRGTRAFRGGPYFRMEIGGKPKTLWIHFPNNL